MNTPPSTDHLLLPNQTVDITNCEREPIHIPGRIQPHGLLFALQEPELTILQASANTAALLSIPVQEILGKPLDLLLQPSDTEALRDACRQYPLDDAPVYLLTLPIAGSETRFDAVLHRSQGVVILELEPEPTGSARQDTYALVKNAVPQIQRARSLPQMFETVAEQVRRINGFDRVMVYQFDAEGHGSVIAESRRDDLEPFLGLHYPASDIPAQARRLYALNLLRLIADVGYAPVDIVPTLHPITQQTLDMSYCILRSVSPIHIQYLKNMGVAASMSISILKDGELWGLIACHHYSSRWVAYDIRTACEFIGQVVSLQLATKQDAADVAYRMRLKEVHAQLVTQMAEEATYQEGLVSHPVNLLSFIEATGAVVCTNGEFRSLGQVPDSLFLQQFVNWLVAHGEQEVFATNALSNLLPPAAAVTQTASGVLAIAVSPAQRNYLLWFRPEVVQTVHWAGDPTKPVEIQADGSQRLSPRGSFALWKETVQGKSLPWKLVEVEAAQDLRRALIKVILDRAELLEALNTQLRLSNTELDAFTYIASHDLREPLRGIRNYAQFLREDYGDRLDAEGQEQLETVLRLTNRMEALLESLLHYSRVGQQELALETTDMNRVVQETLEALKPRLQEAQVEVRIPRALPTIACHPVQAGEIFSNLVSNAIKYNDKEHKWIEIGFLDAEAARQALAEQETVLPISSDAPVPVVFYVRDNGIGIRDKHLDTIFRIFKRLHAREEFGGGTGAGLTIARKIAERHGGKLWVDSRYGEGTTFYFTLQRAGADA